MKSSIVISLFLGIISVSQAKHRHHYHVHGNHLAQTRINDEDEGQFRKEVIEAEATDKKI